MVRKTLDISGKVCPYCLLAVKEETKTMTPGDELVVTCDHPPAATKNIPLFAHETGMSVETKNLAPSLWEIHLVKK
ncbi:sulfurtransferase TusA family protein [Methanoregula sp.]|jgi:TusA-related sulfurtransferase|uniref:sulfurtransferase TusA family protein n=1 Tax=Methanoregula sp. TaxID=2052170 RepID=UPI003C1B5A54